MSEIRSNGTAASGGNNANLTQETQEFFRNLVTETEQYADFRNRRNTIYIDANRNNKEDLIDPRTSNDFYGYIRDDAEADISVKVENTYVSLGQFATQVDVFLPGIPNAGESVGSFFANVMPVRYNGATGQLTTVSRPGIDPPERPLTKEEIEKVNQYIEDRNLVGAPVHAR